MTLDEDDYQREWAAECAISYPDIDAFERRMGVESTPRWFSGLAQVLACPVKKNPACWQHGRVVYAALANLISRRPHGSNLFCLDIGTAKGFSALCMDTACNDVGDDLADWNIVSLDVIDPKARVRRNTVAEVDGLKTLDETISMAYPWPTSIIFLQSTGIAWLKASGERVHFAFIDGKHTYEAVSSELAELARLQRPGDMVVLDDLQVLGVHEAAKEATRWYHIEQIEAVPANETKDRKHAPRRYGVGIRR